MTTFAVNGDFKKSFLSHWNCFELIVRSESALPTFINGHELNIATLVAIARYGGDVKIAASTEKDINAAAAIVTDSLANGDVIYGVNTGYGGSADTRTAAIHAFQATLIRGLHYGILPLGPEVPIPSQRLVSNKNTMLSPSPLSSILLNSALPLNDPQSATCMPESWVRASMLVRLNSLSSGASGVRTGTIETIAELLSKEIIPRIPLRGSISASGDLSPLSYIGGAIQGKPTLLVWSGGSRTEPACKRKLVRADRALARAGVRPVILGPKEGLAIVNGTAVSAGVASLALHESYCHAALAQILTAMSVEALLGTDESFDPFIAEMRPHPGQVDAAKSILLFLSGSKLVFRDDGKELMTLRQDRYSIRTASQWVGPVLEDIMLAHQQLTIELNSVTDNPLIDASGQGRVLNGGNFQAKSVTSAIEKTRVGLQAIGRMLYTQCTELINPVTNRGLPPNLVVDEPSDSFIWKGTDIFVAALTSELGFLANPVGTHVMSAEMGNQALNSLALISARYTLTALDVLSQLVAAHLLALCQALDLRALHHQFVEVLNPHFSVLVRDIFGPLTVDGSSFDELALTALQKTLWNSFLRSYKQNMSLDSKPRITKAIDSLPSLILAVCPKSIATLNAIECFTVRSIDEAIEQHDNIKRAYRAAPDATPLLGSAAKRMYEFVRKTLGVPFFGETEIATPPPEHVEFGKEHENDSDDDQLESMLPPTVGTHISTIYRAICSGKLYTVVAECFRDINTSEVAVPDVL